MGIDMYKVAPTAFERYYDAFLQNSFRGRRFKIVLKSGESSVGVPTSGSIANPLDPNVSFSFKTDDGGMYRIPFVDLKEATVVEPVLCMVRTVAPSTRAAGDFAVLIEEAEVDRLLVAQGPTSVRANLERENDFVDGAPAYTYKYLTVQGSDFRITSIGRRQPSPELSIAIDRL